VSKGGNLLLNVGPTARGTFDYRAQEKLSEMGEWMKYNNPSIYGCTQAPDEFQIPDQSLLTFNPKTNRLYIHLLDYPMKWFTLKGYEGKVKYAQYLHDGSEIKFGKPRHNVTHQEEKMQKDVILILPMVKPNVEIPVIELVLND
jgi:alpha-L-fucosidase